MSEGASTKSTGGLSPSLLVVLGIAATVGALYGLQTLSSVVGPMFLAFTLVLTFMPLRGVLMKKGFPAWLATICTVLAPVLTIIILVIVVAISVGQLATTLPQYAAKFGELDEQIRTLLSKLGFGDEALSRAVNSVDPSSVIGVAQSLASGLSSAVGAVVLMVLGSIFLMTDLPGIGNRLDQVRAAQPHLVDGIVLFANHVRKYWIVSAAFGLIVAVLDVIALAVLGVPLALTWGVLAFVTNFIPNIGFVLGVIPPALLALLASGPVTMLIVIAAYCVINFVIQTLIQPRYMGNAVGLNTTVTFLSLVVWSIFLGPLGALLAVPMSLFVKAMFVDSRPENKWVLPFIGS